MKGVAWVKRRTGKKRKIIGGNATWIMGIVEYLKEEMRIQEDTVDILLMAEKIKDLGITDVRDKVTFPDPIKQIILELNEIKVNGDLDRYLEGIKCELPVTLNTSKV